MGLSRDVWQNVQLAATELKKNGKFKLGGVLNTKLKTKPAKAARKGVNPRILNEHFVDSQTV